MKKLVAVLLCSMLTLGMLACRGSDNGTVQGNEPSEPSPKGPSFAQPLTPPPSASPKQNDDEGGKNTASSDFLQLNGELISWYSSLDPLSFDVLSGNLPRLDEFLDKLGAIDSSQLANNEQYDYAVIESFLLQSIESRGHLIFYEPCEPNSGIHISVPLHILSLPLDTADDAKAYINEMAKVYPLCKEAQEHLQLAIEGGCFMNRATLDKTAKCIDELMEPCKRAIGKQFYTALEGLGLEDSKRTQLETAFERVLTDSYALGFSELGAMLLKNSQSCTPNTGLCNISPAHKVYFEHRLKADSSSNVTVAQAMELLKTRIEEAQLAMVSLYALDENVFMYPQTLSTGSLTSDIAYLEKLTAANLPHVEFKAPAIRYMPKELAPYAGTAVLVQNNPNSPTLLIAEGVETNLLELAGELMPGLCYQNEWMAQNDEGVRFASLLILSGYDFGRAFFAQRLLCATDDTLGSTYTQAVYFARQIELILRAGSSILVNYYGFDGQKLADFLSDYYFDAYTDEFYNCAIEAPFY